MTQTSSRALGRMMLLQVAMTRAADSTSRKGARTANHRDRQHDDLGGGSVRHDSRDTISGTASSFGEAIQTFIEKSRFVHMRGRVTWRAEGRSALGELALIEVMERILATTQRSTWSTWRTWCGTSGFPICRGRSRRTATSKLGLCDNGSTSCTR